MTAHRETIVAVAHDREQAERVVADLRQAGIGDEQISVATLTDEPGTDGDQEIDRGGLLGGGAGTALGALASSMVPGIGWVATGGLLMAGGLLGASAPLNLSEARSRMVITVSPGGHEREVDAILNSHGLHE